MTRAQMKPLLLILIVALAVRLLACGWWQARLGERFFFGDSDGYWALGRAIARGEPYRYGSDQVFRTPGYPLVLAPLFVIAYGEPPIVWGRVVSALLGTLAVAAVWWLGRERFDDRVGRLAALLAALYPGAIAISSVVLSEALFCALMVAQLALWLRAVKADTVPCTAALALGSGVLGGAAVLARPSWLLFAPLAIAVSLLLPGPRWRHFGIGGCVLVGLIAAMLPWWLRNAWVTHHFVPTTLQVGASLYDGLNPAATGASDMRVVRPIMDAERRQFTQRGAASVDSLEYQVDRRLWQAAAHWAGEHPDQVARLAAIKLLRMWNLWPNEPSFAAWPVRLLAVFTYVPILILGIIGAWRTVRCGWPTVVCWLPAVYLSLIHAIFVSSMRYREPAMLPWMVLAAAAAVGWFVPKARGGNVLRGMK
jgi:4-amino-4-deoxy-L-arabinose transferase-like glycosyltransferase